MIETSALFAEKIAESSRQFRARLLYEGAAISGEIRNITINKGACGESFSIGSVYSSYIEGTLDNCEALLENIELQLQIGLLIGDEIEYIDIGYYTVTNPKTSAYSTTFTAVGRITSKLNELFDVPEVLTLENISAAITAATGVAIVFNGEVSDAVLEKEITGMTCKEALSVIAGTFGGFATEDNSGNIVVSKYNTDSTISVDGDRMTSLPEFNDYDYVLYGVKVIVSAEGQDEDSNTIEEVAYTEGTPRLTLTNEFMTEELFESFVANTVGYTYRPGTVPLALGDPRLQPWDCLDVTDVNGNVYTAPCLNIVHTFDGGLSTTITAPGESESESSSSVAGPIAQQIEKLYYELITAQEAIIKRLKTDEILTDDITGAIGSFTKYLTGVKIIGDLIEAGTLKADQVYVKGSDGKYYSINTDFKAMGLEPVEEDAIHGSVLVKESITADLINVIDLFSKNITATGDFNLGGNGALIYDAETGELSIRASELYIGTENVDELNKKTQKSIEFINESLRTLIKGADGESLMTQTENGWEFSIDSLLNTVNQAVADVETLEGVSEQTINDLNEVKKALLEVQKITAYMRFYEVDGDPYLELGTTANGFKSIHTNKGISFGEDADTSGTEIDYDGMKIDRAVIREELQVGGFLLKKRANGNVGFIWRGDEE